MSYCLSCGRNWDTALCDLCAPQPPAGTDDGGFDRTASHSAEECVSFPSPAAAEGLSEATIAEMVADAQDRNWNVPGVFRAHVLALAAEVRRLRASLNLAEQVMARDGMRAATVQVMRNERDQARAALREAHEIMRAIQRNNSGKFYDLEEHLAAHGEATK
jgi:hypothetical protein